MFCSKSVLCDIDFESYFAWFCLVITKIPKNELETFGVIPKMMWCLPNTTGVLLGEVWFYQTDPRKIRFITKEYQVKGVKGPMTWKR